MRHSTGRRTKAQQARFDAIKASGCIVCALRGLNRVYPEIHHLLSGGRRRGHDFTIGLCPWHHRAVPFGDWMNHARCRADLGPSLAEGSKTFHAEHGSDEYLLAAQNARIGVANEAAHTD